MILARATGLDFPMTRDRLDFSADRVPIPVVFAPWRTNSQPIALSS